MDNAKLLMCIYKTSNNYNLVYDITIIQYSRLNHTQHWVLYHTAYGTQEISITRTHMTCESLYITLQLQTAFILVILLTCSFTVLKVQQDLAEDQSAYYPNVEFEKNIYVQNFKRIFMFKS